MSFTTFRKDCYRYGNVSFFTLLLKDHSVRYLLALRCPLLKVYRHILGVRYGLDLGNGSNIGVGLYLGHAYGINVNPQATIGSNCSLHKGCTIGQENRGDRKGAPTLGDKVWIGINATVVGKITIGDDVLIAPNAYVNRDVPSHSIVIGNPAQIVPCANATESYITNIVKDI